MHAGGGDNNNSNAGGGGGGSTSSVWLEFTVPHGQRDYLKFPKTHDEFEEYAIATMVVMEHVSGPGKNTRLREGTTIVVKGNLPSICPLLRYQLGIKPCGTGEFERYGEYDILPLAGFRDAQPLPWTVRRLKWALTNEVRGNFLAPENVERAIEEVFPGPERYSQYNNKLVPSPDDEHVEESWLRNKSFYSELCARSDYYRLSAIAAVRRAWPRNVADIRKMESRTLEKLVVHLRTAPHELCFHRHSREYGLGEMSPTQLTALMADTTLVLAVDAAGKPLCQTKKFHVAAATMYGYLKQTRKSYGHTLFEKERFQKDFEWRFQGSEHLQFFGAAMNWLMQGGHLITTTCDTIDRLPSDRWHRSDAHYIQVPRDCLTESRIMAHLRRIVRNFFAGQGTFERRDPNFMVPAVPKGPCNVMQQRAIDHILNNPITIVQGGPGSGKTFLSIVQTSTIFAWQEVQTHVGRQASAIRNLLGGHVENARTIHSSYYRLRGNVIMMEYNDNIQILVVDECYNCSTREMEMVLESAPEACRVVFCGDPDQIRPIPDELGAGTPALDIARAFPQHVVYLSENMRQRADAMAIHEVVTAVRLKMPEAITWGSLATPELNPAAILVEPTPEDFANRDRMREILFDVIKRLRRGINGDEHAWQMITFFRDGETKSGGNNDGDAGVNAAIGGMGRKGGIGVMQLNDIVQEYLQDSGFMNKATVRCQDYNINKRLRMYPGFKFIITERAAPGDDIDAHGRIIFPDQRRRRAAIAGSGHGRRNSAGKRERASTATASDADGDGDNDDDDDAGGDATLSTDGAKSAIKFYDEVWNGQIEVVRSIVPTPAPGDSPGKPSAWIVECEPKGTFGRGTRILINKHHHVDPNRIQPAWAVTSNQSMGGECSNVCVFVPSGIEQNKFFPDRSHLYVGVSRPEHLLIVVGTQAAIKIIASRDPPKIVSGIYERLRGAALMTLEQKTADKDSCCAYVDWKQCLTDFVDPKIYEGINVHDQTGRVSFPHPVPIKAVAYSDFREERAEFYNAMDPKARAAAIKEAKMNRETALWRYEVPMQQLYLSEKLDDYTEQKRTEKSGKSRAQNLERAANAVELAKKYAEDAENADVDAAIQERPEEAAERQMKEASSRPRPKGTGVIESYFHHQTTTERRAQAAAPPQPQTKKTRRAPSPDVGGGDDDDDERDGQGLDLSSLLTGDP